MKNLIKLKENIVFGHFLLKFKKIEKIEKKYRNQPLFYTCRGLNLIKPNACFYYFIFII